MKQLGFIGLGIMGKPMARNLLKAGCPLTVYTHQQAVVDELVTEGAMGAASSAEVAEKSDIIFIMVPNSPNVRDVVLGAGGILEGMRPGTIVVDCSSIDPSESKAIGAEIAAAGGTMVDAPVSGGEPKAIDGTLAFMCGGTQEAFEEVKPLLELMGSSVTRCGELGAGNTTKLANQIIVACNIAAVSEALTLGKQLGVEPKVIFEAIRGGLAGSTVMNAKVPMMIAHDFRPGFRINLHIKDLNNAVAAADKADIALPLSSSVLKMMKQLDAEGVGTSDHSALLAYYEQLNNVRL